MNLKFESKSRSQYILDRALSIAIFVLIAVVAFGAGYMKGSNPGQTAFGADELQVGLIEKTYAELNRRYVKPLKDYKKDLLYGAMRGMVEVLHREPFLDPYSSFLDPSGYRGLNAETTGSYAGIGVRIEIDPDKMLPRISSVFRGSPAADAGLKVNDYITMIAGASTEGLTLDEIGKRITGKEGTKVSLTVSDAVTHITRDVEITRKTVTIHSVEDSRIIAPQTGYIRIASFSENTTKETLEALQNLDKLGMKKLIIDLRGNGGGTLDNAIDIAGMFLPKGAVVTRLVYRNEAKERKVEKDFPRFEIPVIILVDMNTASASEVLAGALRDHGKAVLVGEKTFGKGKVQEIVEIKNDASQMRLEDFRESANVIVYGYELPDGSVRATEVKADPDPARDTGEASVEGAITALTDDGFKVGDVPVHVTNATKFSGVQSDQLAIVLTVATYFTPNGHDIDANGGLEPDVQISFEEYKSEIPRLAEIEAEVNQMRDRIIKARQEFFDSMSERDVVLGRVQDAFDDYFAKGSAARDKSEAEFAAKLKEDAAEKNPLEPESDENSTNQTPGASGG
ncbi:MAG: S41 family peptidase [bacterium]